MNQVCAGGRREGGKRLGGDHVCFTRRPEKSSAASGGGRNGGLLLFSTCSLVSVYLSLTCSRGPGDLFVAKEMS